jgi:hypothetical protein
MTTPLFEMPCKGKITLGKIPYDYIMESMQVFTYYGTSWVQAIVSSATPLGNLGEPSRGEPKFPNK